jgi:hypothetical protein
MISPEYHRARAAEIRNRLITYLPAPPPLTLLLRPPRYRFLASLRRGLWQARTGGLATLPLCHFTLRHRAELSLVANAVLGTATPREGDIFQFLWRLHPWFMRPENLLANQGHRMATPREQRHALATRRRLLRLTPQLDLPAATILLRAWLGTAQQDEPATAFDLSGPPSPLSHFHAPAINHLDDLSDYFIRTYGLRRDEVLDSPQAWLYQLHRNKLLAEPDGPERVIDPSTALLSR